MLCPRRDLAEVGDESVEGFLLDRGQAAGLACEVKNLVLEVGLVQALKEVSYLCIVVFPS
jgi:hypothetical protein